MASIGDRGFFGLASGQPRPCVVVSGPKDLEGIVYYDLNVDVGPDDQEFLDGVEQDNVQYARLVGDLPLPYGLTQVRRRARQVQGVQEFELGKFWIP